MQGKPCTPKVGKRRLVNLMAVTQGVGTIKNCPALAILGQPPAMNLSIYSAKICEICEKLSSSKIRGFVPVQELPLPPSQSPSLASSALT
ncbi:MAG: hypothetical protein ACRESZ_02000, partial [Methylococcales bacterium]